MGAYERTTFSDPLNAAWRGLYRTAGAASAIIAVFIPAQLFVFFIWPPPDTVIGWFTLFQQSPFVGLLDMDMGEKRAKSRANFLLGQSRIGQVSQFSSSSFSIP